MRNTAALALAAALAFGFDATAEAASPRKRKGKKKVKVKRRKITDARSLIHGPDIWAEAITKVARDKQGNIIYRENIPIDEENSRQAAVLQTSPAPEWTGDEGFHLTVSDEKDLAESFGDAYNRAFDILGPPYEEGEAREAGEEALPGAERHWRIGLTSRDAVPRGTTVEGLSPEDVEAALPISPENLEELDGISEEILACARQFVRIYETLEREGRIEGAGRLHIDAEARRGEVDRSILNAIDEWLEVVRRLETNATRLRYGALTRSPERLRKGWRAVYYAANKIDALDYWIQARRAKSKKRAR